MTTAAIAFDGEPKSNAMRAATAAEEPIALRTFTPSQLVIERSAGLFHWTPDGRRLADFTSGVLVANLGHNPTRLVASPRPLHGLDGASSSSEDDGDYFRCRR